MNEFELISLFLFILGAMVGSFANVVIYRLPQGQSVVTPRSHCFECKKTVPWYHNIPIFSFFILRGQCFSCKAKFSIRYSLVELLIAVVFVVSYQQLGWSWFLLEFLIFVSCLVIVSFIDIDYFILPDVFTLSGIVIGLVGAVLNPEREFLPAVYGVLMGGGFLWAIAYIYYAIRKEEGMGGGDIKLLAWIGAILGWSAIPFVILSSSLFGAVIGILFSFKSKEGLQSVIPFGPYLAFGAVLYAFWGVEIGDWYLKQFLMLPNQ